MINKPYIVIDFETYSPVPIKHGLDRYFKSAEILIAAWCVCSSTDLYLIDCNSNTFYENLKSTLESYLFYDTLFVAHNYQFEQLCIEKCLGLNIPQEQFICTQSLCAVNGLPLGLDKACEYLGIKGKDPEGKRLIKFFSEPRKPTKNNLSTRNLPEDYPEKFSKFIDYCKQDVAAETDLLNELLKMQADKTNA